ncbi:two pore domain potassium channel family protein [Marinobacter lipolyticus]|uniref:potassium channel family protein n=1 Tax=Marinobacter lipolyticus TaxID=209639 RepID=UPI001BD1637A|nr:potassium channel family protein [Marinobacter lipolyticus]MBS8241514.1 two pore domain potassium channel family protein [Marinobacter lipolyticus]
MDQDLVYLISGATVITVVMLDVLCTTLTTQGSGPITQVVTAGAGAVSQLMLRVTGTREMLITVGPGTMVLLGTLWLLFLWLGWWLVFSAFPSGILHAQSGMAADLADRAYFIGFTLSTLGVGDFKPSGEVPKLLTVVAAFNGLVLVTLIITYALPLVQAVIVRRTVAFRVSLLGANPQEVVHTAWQTGNRRSFEDELDAISGHVIECAEQRLAYPMLDLFYGKQACFSLGLQLTILDEALSVLRSGLQADYRWYSLKISKTQAVITHYLRRVGLPMEDQNPPTPPVPSTCHLKRLAVPVADNLEASFQTLARRRARLHALVRKEGWDWDSVESGECEGEDSPSAAPP